MLCWSQALFRTPQVRARNYWLIEIDLTGYTTELLPICMNWLVIMTNDQQFNHKMNITNSCIVGGVTREICAKWLLTIGHKMMLYIQNTAAQVHM